MVRVVVQVGSEEVAILGRSALIVAWVARNWQQVNRWKRGQLQFTFRNAAVIPALNAEEEEVSL